MNIRLSIFLIFILAQVCLAGYLKLTDHPFSVITADGNLYMNLAQNFIDGKGLINTVRKEDIIVLPLFSLLMVPSLLLFKSIIPFIAFQYVLFGINAVLLYFLAIYVFKKQPIAWLAVLFYCTHPVLLLNGPHFLLTEIIYTFFVLIITFALLRLIKSIFHNPTTISKNLIWVVTIITVSMLLRPHMLYVIPLLGLIVVYLLFQRKLSFKTVVTMVLIPFILFGANLLHNLYIHDEAVLFENYSGQNVYIANNPNSKTKLFLSTEVADFVEPYYFTLKDRSLSEKSAILKERAIKFILKEPVLTTKRTLIKWVKVFRGISPYDTITVALFWLGLILYLFRKNKDWPTYIVLGYLIIGFTMFTSIGLLVGGQRYRVPIIPIYLMFSSYAVYAVFMVFWRSIRR
jgi:hypothetical protein